MATFFQLQRLVLTSISQEFDAQPYRTVSDIDYDYVFSGRRTVRSLKELSVRKVLTSDILSDTKCFDLPYQLRNIIFQYAITYGYKTSITGLLKAWTQQQFVFEAPLSFRTWTVFAYDRGPPFICKVMEAFDFVELIINHFITLLTSEQRNKCPVRCLDFSSFPICGPQVQTICKLIIEKCKLYLESTVSSEKYDAANKEKYSGIRSPLNKCVIKINCIIYVEEDISWIIQALSHGRDRNTPLYLLITGVHIPDRTIAFKNVLPLLDLLEPEAVDAFSCCLPFSMLDGDFCVVRKLRSFPNLRALNFELNFSNKELRDRLRFELPELVHQMRNLKQFHLSHYEDKDIQIFQRLPMELFTSGQLESLFLRGHCLTPRGFKHLRLLTPLHELRALNMSCAKHDLQSLVSMLAKCTNLRVLDLEECRFSEDDTDILFQTFSAMKKLKFLNIKHIYIEPEDLLSKAEYISRTPSLQCLLIGNRYRSTHDHDIRERFRRCLAFLCPSRSIIIY